MKNIKIIPVVLVSIITVVSAFTISIPGKSKVELNKLPAATQTVNLFVTHGHCSTPFGGVVNDLRIAAPEREDSGNPLEGMDISFQIDPNSFTVCAADDLTARIKTPGLFIGETEEMLTFKSTNVYTMGVDWYQVNGKLSIKGVERDVKLFVTGIRNPEEQLPNTLVLEGQFDLFDWGIDYDKIVNGEAGDFSANPTKWMHLNMRVDLG